MDQLPPFTNELRLTDEEVECDELLQPQRREIRPSRLYALEFRSSSVKERIEKVDAVVLIEAPSSKSVGVSRHGTNVTDVLPPAWMESEIPVLCCCGPVGGTARAPQASWCFMTSRS